MTPSNPIDHVSELKVPVLGLYGRQDQSIPQDSIERMKQALANDPPPAKNSQFVVYDDAPHAFFADLSFELPQGGRRGRLEARARVVPRAARRQIRRFRSTQGFGPVATGRPGSALHSLHEPG